MSIFAGLISGSSATIGGNVGIGIAVPTAKLHVNGNVLASSFTGSLLANNGIFSASAQVDHNATTNYSANRHIDHTAVSISSGTGLTGGGDISSTRTLALTGQALAFHNLATNGLVTRTAADTIVARTLAAGTGITVTNGDGVSGNPTVALTSNTISGVALGNNLNALTISSPLSGTSYNGSSAVTIALSTGYGDTQNPYASKTANTFLASPNGSSGAPTFRAIVAADIPTLNQNTTGTASNITAYTINQNLGTSNSPSWQYIGVNPSGTGNNGYGISLYSGAQSTITYGLMFQQTATYGVHGSVTGDWATYFLMNADVTRGWIFKQQGSSNVAAISAGGVGTFTGIYASDAANANTGRIVNPGGGHYISSAGAETGAWKIKLPTAKNNSSTMLRFTVKMYQYTTGQSITWEIGGYNYSLGNWYNIFATQLSDAISSGYTVRFGYDGTGDCIWIGETNSSWSYPQLYITDVQVGYSNYDPAWATGWSISKVTSFDTVEQSRTAAVVWTATNDGASSGLDADLLDGQQGSYYTTAGNLSGTIPSAVLGNSTVYVGTTAIALNRTSGTQTLTGVSINGSAASAGIVNGTTGQILRVDDRIIAPSDITSGYLQFGFTSWANNNTSPYADFLHMRGYTDSSGGNDNLIMFRKDAIGMRIYQQTFGSGTAYSSYADVILSNGSYSDPSWISSLAGSKISGNITGNAANITAYTINQNVGTGNSPTFAGLTVDTNTLHVDAGNNRVGIGTTSPGQTLDVIGRIRLRSDGSVSAGAWHTDSTGTQNVFVGLDGVNATDAWGVYSNTNWRFQVLNTNGDIVLNGKSAFVTNDTWLRINQSATFSSGVWFGSTPNLALGGTDSYLSLGSNGGTTNSRVYVRAGTYNGTNVINLDGTNGTAFFNGTVSIGTNAARPMTINPANGAITIKGDSGGWSMGTLFYGSSNTYFGGFGALGSGNTLSKFWIGAEYNNSWLDLTSSAVNSIVALQQNGNQVLHAGNYNSYAPTLTGGGASGTWSISISGNSATVTNGMYLSGDQNISGVKTFYTPSGQTFNGASGNIGLSVFNPAAGDAMMTFHVSGDYAGYFGLGGAENDLVWTGWSVGGTRNRILHSGNYTSWAPSLTGTGASGTWSISITGAAGSVAWSAISGHRTLTRDNAGLRGDAGARSGFFETNSPTNYYSGASSWQHLIETRHTNDANNYAMQFAGSFFDQLFYARKTNDSATTAWSRLLTENTSGQILMNGVTYTWPGSQGSANTVLTNNGSGTLSWSSPSGTTSNQWALSNVF